MKTRTTVFALLAMTCGTILQAGDLKILGNLNIATNLSVGADQGFKWDSTNGVQVTLPSTATRGVAVRVYAGSTNTGNDAFGLFTTNGATEWLVGMEPDRSFRIYSGTFGADVFRIYYDNTYFHATLFTDSQDIEKFDVRADEEIDGKLTVYGGMDPPYLLLDSETRDSIANRVAHEVPPSKQTGAALFWNQQSKQLEVYVASDGAFYDVTGKTLAVVGAPKVDGATVTRAYRLDRLTGGVLVKENLDVPHWRVKRGYRFDAQTGIFTTLGATDSPPIAVSSQEALELK